MSKISNYGTKTSTDGADTLIIVDSDDSSNKKVTLSNLLPDGSVDYAAIDSTFLSGWITETATWTYASGTGTNVGTFTVSGDYTSIYNVGDRLKFTQTTVKYAIVTKVAYSAPNTTVTIYMGTDYTIANAAISSNYYSKMKSPQGFPLDPSKWTVTTSSTADDTQSSPTASTWYNPGSRSITIPIGVWSVSYQVVIRSNTASSAHQSVLATLSTANNSQSDSDLTASIGLQDCAVYASHVSRSKTLSLTSETTYYLNCETLNPGISAIGFYASAYSSPTIIRAICAYL